MKTLLISISSVVIVTLVSCQNQSGNPYGAPAANQMDSPETNPYAIPQPNGETGNTSPYQSLPGVGNSLPPVQAPAYSNNYSANSPGATNTSSDTTIPHTVVKGDSLWKLARDYNTTVEAIKISNGLTSDNIRLGQTIQIPNN